MFHTYCIDFGLWLQDWEGFQYTHFVSRYGHGCLIFYAITNRFFACFLQRIIIKRNAKTIYAYCIIFLSRNI